MRVEKGGFVLMAPSDEPQIAHIDWVEEAAWVEKWTAEEKAEAYALIAEANAAGFNIQPFPDELVAIGRPR